MRTETYTSYRQWFYNLMNTREKRGFWKPLFWLLTLMSIFYYFLVKVRLVLYKVSLLKTKVLPKRVISVGNMTVGGTGKTPTVLALARFFQKNGVRVAILSRGYGRSDPNSIRVVSDGQQVFISPALAGEEAYLLAKELKGVIVAVGKNRFRTGQFLLKKYEIDLFILDDGYQHLNLYRGTNILLLDSAAPFGNSYLLPRGILREPISAIKRASMILLAGKGNLDIQTGEYSECLKTIRIPKYSVRFLPAGFVNMTTSEYHSGETFGGKTAVLVSGIGNPKSFRSLVESFQIEVVRELVFPDHHSYFPDDIEAIADIARSRKADFIITTDKDAVKLYSRLKTDIPVLILKLDFKTEEDFPWEALKTGKC
jgi:tetraacyldisaccharide 4'-kinase